MAHPHADLLARGYEAFGKGDMEHLAGLMDDDVVWHNKQPGPLAGTYDGKQAVFGFFGRLVEEFDTIEQDIHAILADDVHGVAMLRTNVTRRGRHHTIPAVHVFHIGDDQRITEAWTLTTEWEESAAIWQD